jgi:hypothetical protein
VFEGEKTVVFWIGLIIVGAASVALFGILWMIVIWNGQTDRLGLPYQAANVVGFIVILIGFYMMKSGTEKERP